MLLVLLEYWLVCGMRGQEVLVALGKERDVRVVKHETGAVADVGQDEKRSCQRFV